MKSGGEAISFNYMNTTGEIASSLRSSQ